MLMHYIPEVLGVVQVGDGDDFGLLNPPTQ